MAYNLAFLQVSNNFIIPDFNKMKSKFHYTFVKESSLPTTIDETNDEMYWVGIWENFENTGMHIKNKDLQIKIHNVTWNQMKFNME